MRIAVVGAGIAGLSAAFRLVERARRLARPLALTVFEADPRVGGHAVTLADAGFRVETGPNAFLDRPAERHAFHLAEALGLAGELIEARPAAARRFIAFGGTLRRVPDSPPALVTTNLLSAAGKLRLMREPWVGAAPAGVEETVFDFACRRLGREAAERLVDPAVSGITAGDSRALSVSAAFPLMTKMEREHGSLFRAMTRARARVKPKLMSFRGGLDALTGALAASLGGAVRVNARVTRVTAAAPGWWVEVEGGGEPEMFDRVVLATHAYQAAPLVWDLDRELSAALEALPTAGLALVALAFRRQDLKRDLNGYGYLIARTEGFDTLGVVWESSLFEGRAPEGAVLLRVLLGGAIRHEVADLPDSDLEQRARHEIGRLMGTSAAPLRSWIRRFPRAITQYTLGHDARIAAIRARLGAHAGLELCGTSYDGVSFNAAVAAGEHLAERVFREAPEIEDPRTNGCSTTDLEREKAHA